MVKKIALISTLTIVLFFQNYAQKAPIKFGKPSREDLEMKYYPLDSTAPAAILCNYGYFNESQFQFVRIVRIKIFKKEGYDYANISIPGSMRTLVKGITFNLENGEVVETKLKNESIFRERITENIYRINIAMPSVKEGSVVDFEFSIPGFIDEWEFQSTIPVRWSELIIEPSVVIGYSKNFFGYELLAVSTDRRWVAMDMPAFKPEPYISSYKNYITRFEFDITEIRLPRIYYPIATTWEVLNSSLIENKYFGMPLNTVGFMASTIKEIKSQSDDPFARMKAAYNAIKIIKYNGFESATLTDNSLSPILKNYSGNSADINLALVYILKRLGVDAYPVVLSTKENGILSQYRPSLQKLNYVIACAKIKDQQYLLDATEAYMPYDMLPLRVLNGKGRLVDFYKPEWVDLQTNKRERIMSMYSLELKENMELVGSLNNVRSDYAAFDFRKKYHSFSSDEEFLSDLIEKKKGLNIQNFKIEALDSIELPIKDSYSISIKGQVSNIGDQVLIYPLVHERLLENPFKAEIRKYPVDFGYPREQMVMVKIKIPKGFEVQSIPKDQIGRIPDNSAIFHYTSSINGDQVQIIYRQTISKTLFLMDEYEILKDFFSKIIAKQSEPIILKKQQ